MMRRLLLASAACAALMVATSASAQVATANLTVQVNVTEACTITAGTIDFGTWDQTNQDMAATGVTVTCSPDGTATQVQMANTGTMTNGASSINYEIYNGNPAVVGSALWPAAGMPYTGTSAGTPITIWGRIPQNQNPTLSGLHTGTLQMTVSF